MRLLFIHQNLPGQFRHLLEHFASDPANQVIGLGEQIRLKANADRIPKGVQLMGYETPRKPVAESHYYLQSTEAAVLRGQSVVRALLHLKSIGFVPDLIYAHPGWGESLYIKDVYPETPLLNFCEFYYRSHGLDVGFDPEFPHPFNDQLQLRTRNSRILLSLDSMDLGISPMPWQKSCFPTVFQSKIEVVHDGINTDKLIPNLDASLYLPANGTGSAEMTLTRHDEVITYVSRNLEPQRGFHTFMRALPRMLRERPKAQVVIVGAEGVSYGKASADGSYRVQMLKELEGQLDLSRIHFLGFAPYELYMNVLHVSSVHIYLTYPFVLSWSMLEAMSAGCLVVGSKTQPVTEVIEDGVNGLLIDFFNTDEMINAVNRVFEDPERMAGLRINARQTIVDHYDLKKICLPRQLALLQGAIDGKIGLRTR
jgi:glycosyltransferase involved in cell wall biosynthesis